MIKIFTLVLIVTICACADDNSVRQKRLLFFDEEGTLVKTYQNPYMNHLALTSDIPIYGKFLNPFFSFIRAFGESLIAFAIPVSRAIIEQINKDPNFQQSLIVVPKNPVVEPNPLCSGKRTQIPSPAFCNNFLNCWDGWAFEQECPKGLLFSNEGYCDYAGNVDCHNRKLDYEKLQPEPVCNKDFESFRNKNNCHEFFVCVNREPVRFKCPANLAYSQLLGVCDYADRVDCKSSEIPSISQLPNLKPIPVIPPFLPTIPAKPLPIEIPGITSPAIPVQVPNKPIILPSIPQTPAESNPSSSVPSAPIPSNPIQSAPSPTESIPSAPILSAPTPSEPIPSAPIPSAPIIPLESNPQIPSSELRPLPVMEQAAESPKPSEKPTFPWGTILAPGCSGHVAKSLEDAIRQLQRSHTDN